MVGSILARLSQTISNIIVLLVTKLFVKNGKGLVDGRYVLLMSWLVVNILGFGLVAVAQFNGWIGMMFAADPTFLTSIISCVFLFGLGASGAKLYKINSQIDFIRSGQPEKSDLWSRHDSLRKSHDHDDPTSLIESLKVRVFGSIILVKELAEGLVVLGLIGTVIGFIIALSGIDPSAVADVSAIGPMVSHLITGMSVALYTTLVGSVLNVWLKVNYHILGIGASDLYTIILETAS